MFVVVVAVDVVVPTVVLLALGILVVVVVVVFSEVEAEVEVVVAAVVFGPTHTVQPNPAQFSSHPSHTLPFTFGGQRHSGSYSGQSSPS